MPPIKRLLIFLFSLLLTACAPGPGVAEPTETPTPVPTAIVLPDTPTPAQPTETPRPIGPACRLDFNDVELGAASYGEYPNVILSYLNAGGSPALLSDMLNARGIAAQPVSVAVADFTGDGRDDLAAALINPEADDLDGRLIIYGCVLADYEIIASLRADAPYRLGFHIWHWQDLNADGSAELVVSRALCGAHTCFEDVEILSYDGAGFVNRLDGDTSELPYPNLTLTDPDGDGLFRLEIATGGFGSVGAGPQRPVTYFWEANPGASTWKLTETRADPSPFRIHVLHDADDAAARGEYEDALALYRRVIEEDGLDDWMVGEGGRAALSAYAHFRIVAILVALSEDELAAFELTSMDSRYPASNPNHDFVEMAILFRNAHGSGGLDAACSAAAGFAESHAQVVLDPLGSGVYGYANRDYTGESMCPAPIDEDAGT